MLLVSVFVKQCVQTAAKCQTDTFYKEKNELIKGRIYKNGWLIKNSPELSLKSFVLDPPHSTTLKIVHFAKGIW